MSSPTIAKASRVDRALERLEAAVHRLDTASANVSSTPEPADGDGLAELRDENAKLKSLNLDAAEKLTGTIARLEAVLDGEGKS